MAKISSNPSMQCSVCGQWKRQTGTDDNGQEVRRFYPCCGPNGEYDHEKNVCTDCCTENAQTTKCPYDLRRIVK
jgi:hypothetical protein